MLRCVCNGVPGEQEVNEEPRAEDGDAAHPIIQESHFALVWVDSCDEQGVLGGEFDRATPCLKEIAADHCSVENFFFFGGFEKCEIVHKFI